MDVYLTALALAALPAAGNFLGSLLSEVLDVSERMLSMALHLAAGIVLGVVAVELLPEAFVAEEPWAIIVAFGGGGLTFVLVDRAIDIAQRRLGGESGAGAWAIFFGVSADLFSDGVIIGVGKHARIRLALLLALGQTPADVPEGFRDDGELHGPGPAGRRRVLLTLAKP